MKSVPKARRGSRRLPSRTHLFLIGSHPKGSTISMPCGGTLGTNWLTEPSAPPPWLCPAGRAAACLSEERDEFVEGSLQARSLKFSQASTTLGSKGFGSWSWKPGFSRQQEVQLVRHTPPEQEPESGGALIKVHSNRSPPPPPKFAVRFCLCFHLL